MDLQAAVLEPGKPFAARMAAYLPSLLAAILIVVVGWVLAKFARLLVFRFLLAGLSRHSLGETDVLATLTRYAVVAFTVALTLEELGIAPELVRWALVIVLGGVCLGLALAFGLGCPLSSGHAKKSKVSVSCIT